MGSTLSKAKHLHIKTLTIKTSISSDSSDSTKVEVEDIPVESRPTKKSAVLPIGKKQKHRKPFHHHHHVGSDSVKKRTKPKYKKVTKSIIGKPTNFKHTNHMGAGDILGSSVDVTALSHELNDIAQQINCFEQKVLGSKKQPTSSPPAPPPHLFISPSVKKRAVIAAAAAATTIRKTSISMKSKPNLSASSPVVPMSFRRKPYRKAGRHHHPNLGLVNALMIEIPTPRSVPTP